MLSMLTMSAVLTLGAAEKDLPATTPMATALAEYNYGTGAEYNRRNRLIGQDRSAEVTCHHIVRDNQLGIEYRPNHSFEFVLRYARGFRILEGAVRPHWAQSGY